jgi:ferredoxin
MRAGRWSALPDTVLPIGELDRLVQALRRDYTVQAPVLERGALVIRPIDSAAELPRGVVDEQEPGRHSLRQEGERYFDYTVPADSWKRLFFPPRQRLWRASGADGALATEAEPAAAAPVALLGVRGCDLAAIAIQDRVFLGGAYVDPHYRARRDGAFIVAVNCARATSTCFCTSLGTGPRAGAGYDLALTELGAAFLVEAGTDRGAELVRELGLSPATEADRADAAATVAATADSITRTLPAGIAGTLKAAQSSRLWEAIAERCLSCGNCTLVCPTCFCSAAEHTSDLAGSGAQERRWDSCFSAAHSYIHGGSVRASTAARYRQWMTHKLSTWHDQFGTSGCTGCGRCAVWCPVAIDLTAEAHAFTAEMGGASR